MRKFLISSALPMMLAVALAQAPFTAGAAQGNARSSDSHYILSPEPGVSEVSVSSSLPLKLLRMDCFSEDREIELCAPHVPSAPELAGVSLEWRVNGIPGGNASIGTIHARDNSPIKMIYVAPARIPAPNPVDVSVVIRRKGRTGEEQLVRQVRIVDQPGWRGNIQVRIFSYFDKQEMQDENVARTVSFQPSFSIYDKERPVDSTVIESNLHYTVTGVLADAVDEDGAGLVVLQVRPDGSMAYTYRKNQMCDYQLDVAQGTISDIYRSTPLPLSLDLRPDGSSSIQSIPGVAFAMRGVQTMEACDGSGGANGYDSFFDGVTITGDLVDTPKDNDPAPVGIRGIDGKPGNGRTFEGSTVVPITIRYAGEDHDGEAEIVWSISRK